MSLFPFDEINALKSQIGAVKSADTATKRRAVDKYIDEVTDLFVLAYVYGTREVSDELGEALEPNMDEMRAAIEERFDGKNYIDRLTEYMQSGTEYDIERVIDTDTHRVYEAAKLNAAVKGGATMKTWATMLDDRVRDSHQYLEGVTIPIDAYFYSFRGGRTLYPGQWGIAEEDINCRCTVEYSKA